MDRASILFVILAGFFVTNALVAEFIGVKIFELETSLGLSAFEWPLFKSLFGTSGPLVFSAGVLTWPLVFIMTDIINEYYGAKGVRLLSFLTVGLIAYTFLVIFMAIDLAPAQWWLGVSKERGISDMQVAFSQVYGQSNWIIVGSLVAFLIGQILDAFVFQTVRRRFGEKHIWFRATFSTVVSQLIDSFVVLYIAFVLGPQQWSLGLFFSVGTVNYLYKVCMAILLIPLIYLVRHGIDRFLGSSASDKLRESAMQNSLG